MNIFDFMYDTYKIDKPVRLIELFAGYGSQALALKYLNVKFEHHFVCEFDKYAMRSYNEIHNTTFNPSDVCKIKAQDLKIVDRDIYIYILTYSFPCQDLSLAGNRKGMEKGSDTRSGLLWQVERLLKECKGELPHVLLMENVPQVIKAKGWREWNEFLESLGYKNYCEILNAKDYGIPQNRERCFMISILGDYNYTFPQKIPLKLRLKDMLEDNVDEKFYLSDKMIKYITSSNHKWTGNNDQSVVNKTIASTINTGEGSRRCDASNYICDNLEEETDLKSKRLFGIFDKDNKKYVSDQNVVGTIPSGYNKNQGCVIQEQGGAVPNLIPIKNNTKQGYLVAQEGDGIDISSRMEYHRGTVQNGISQTLTCAGGNNVGVVVKDNCVVKIGNYSPSGHNASSIVAKEGIAPTVMENHGTITAIVENGYLGTYNYSKSDNFMKGKSRFMKGKEIVDTLLASGNNNGVVVEEKEIIPYGSYYTWKDKQGNINTQCNRAANENKCALTVACANTGMVYEKNLRIRKLTPRECFRLMGVKDEDSDKITCSNNQKYKQAGNSIVVDVLMAIFKELF